MKVHTVEHRQWASCNHACLDNVVMHIASTREKAIEFMKRPSDSTPRGWYAVFTEIVDATEKEFCANNEYAIFDLQGNELKEVPLR